MSVIPASEPELLMTEAEYLAFEDAAETKHEFVDGHVYDWRREPMLDYGDVLVDEQSQLFTPDSETIWVTRDGRHIPLTQLEDAHLAAIRHFLLGDVVRHSTWIGYIDGEIARRSRAS